MEPSKTRSNHLKNKNPIQLRKDIAGCRLLNSRKHANLKWTAWLGEMSSTMMQLLREF